MKPIFRIFSFSVCASLTFFWLPEASAQSSGADVCAFLAGRITPGNPRQVTPGGSTIFQQVIQSQVYLKCLQSHGQQAARVAVAAAKAGTFTTFDPPGSLYTWNVVGITLAGAIGGSYIDSGFLEHGFLRSP